MMMMDMDKNCHCGAKVRRFLKAPKKLWFIFATYSK